MPSIGRFRYVERPPSGRQMGTLVLLHAFPLNARMFEPQLALADRGWRVIAPHVRGVDGGTADPPTAHIDDFAADLVDLLDALHLDDVVLGGVSMGGYLAFAILRLAPNYVRALVLADTKAEADNPDARAGRQRMLALVAERGADAVAEEMAPRLLGETTRRTQPEVVARVRALTTANSSESIAGMIRALMSRPDSTPLLDGIHVPTLILVGDEDTVTPRAAAEAMHARIAGSQLEVIAQAGHLSNIEQPDVFNGALARFLTHRV